MKYLIAILSFFCVLSSNAQPDSIIIVNRSERTRAIIQELPFDQVFYLEEPTKKGEVLASITIYKMHNGDVVPYSDREKALIRKIYDGAPTQDNTKSTQCSFRPNGEVIITLIPIHYKNYKEKTCIKIFPLNPVTSYFFDVVKSSISKEKANPKNIKLIKDGYLEDETKLSTSEGLLLSGLDYTRVDARMELFGAINDYRFKAPSKAIKTLLDYDSKLGESGKQLEKQISDLISLEEDTLTTTGVDIKAALDACHNAQMLKVLECDTCKRFINEIKPCKDSCFNLIIPPSSELFKQINSGLLPLVNAYASKPKETQDYKGRRENIAITINYIEKLLAVSSFVIDDECLALIAERDKLYNYLAVLDELMKGWSKVVSEISNYKIDRTQPLLTFKSTNTIGDTGGGITMTSKGKFVVRPDFGVGFGSSLVGLKQPTGAFTKVAPFIGVRINFRPLDVNLSYGQIMMKTFMHRSSVNLSLTTNSFADGVTRFDLFKKQNFLIGYGFRLNNAMNLSAGAIFYQRLNPDPFITSKRLAVMPYIGFSVDFEILESFNKLINVFTK
ncbi:MAG: hypothetical protein GQ574_24010 [Crocinitomix sp.]|nr:hypothetical protein [Crocinitomix sp.]